MKKELLYDADTSQKIPLKLEQNGEVFHLFHVIKPLTDERFFQLEAESEESLKRAKTLKSSIITPKFKLWQELVEEIIGYEEDPEWKENMYPLDAATVINGLLHVEALTPEGKEKGVLFSRNKPIEIITRRLFNGTLIENSHFFRVESQEERDEYLAIISNEPNPNALASAEKKCAAERFCDLYDKICKESFGYKGRVPAPDKSAAAAKFFQTQFERLGK